MSNLTLKHLDDLRNSTLSDETITKYGIISLSEAEVRTKLNRNDISGGGWFIQYPSSSFFRIKLDNPIVIKRQGKKDQIVKYLNSSGVNLDLLITHLAQEKRNNPITPYYFTEGEKKALALEQLGYAAVGLPGVNGYSKNKQVGNPLLNLIVKDRFCFIVFDSDKYTNSNVLKTEYDLAIILRQLGAKVGIINLSPSRGKGIDDQIEAFMKDGKIDVLKKQCLETPQSYEEYIIQHKSIKEEGIYTDVWNGEQLVRFFGKNIRWCGELKAWFIWTGKFWKRDIGDIKLQRFAKKTTKEMLKSEDKNLRKHGQRSQSRNCLSAMVDVARSEDGIEIETNEFNRGGYLLNCNNYIVDLKTGQTLPHDPAKYISRIVNVDYDEKAECPRWLEFLNDIFNGNQNIIGFLQKAVGYSLVDSTCEHCFFICYGKGRNGKNTFFDTIRALLGDYGCKTAVTTLMVKGKNSGGASEDIADLWGKRFVIASESDTSHRLSESTIKELTGDKSIKARFLYSHLFEFTPTFKIFLITNKKPNISGTDEGIWSRVRMVPFTKFIPPGQRIPDLADWLIKNEGSGILTWLVKGCLKWQSEGLGETEEIKVATKEYRDSEDLIGNYIKERCAVNEVDQISASELYKNFKKYSEELFNYAPSIQEFHSYLEELGFEHKRITYGPNKGCMFWYGIGLSEKGNPESGYPIG